MRSVSANARLAMRTLDYKIVTNNGSNAVYTSSDIISIDIQRKLTDKGVSIGNAISDRLSVTLRKSENDIPMKTRVIAYVKFGDDVDWTMIGRFYVTKCTKNKHGYLNVTAMDFLNLLDKECKWKAGGGAESPLTFPATHQEMLDYIVARYSLTCGFECQDWIQETKPEGYTYRQILGFIAASHAANVQIDEDGAVTFVQFLKNDTVNYPLSASNVISQTIDETAGYTVNGLYIEVDDNTDIYIDGTEGSEYDEDAVGIVKVKNPFASVAIANYCWTRLGGLSYVSTTITKRATTALQCGDVIPVYDYAGEPAQLKAAVTAIHYTVDASGGFQEQITSYADTGENKKTTPNKKAEKASSIPADFFSAADPANAASNKVKKDDEWYVRNNDNDKYLLEIKRRVLVSEATAESEAVYEWETVAVIPAGGGVGEDLGNGDIRFNSSDNTVTNSNGKNTLFGGSNSMTGCFESIVGGYNNSLTGCDYSWVWGARNTVTVRYGAVFGEENTVNSYSNRGLTCGNGNQVTNGSDDDLVTGVGNTLNNTRRCVVAGMSATYNNSTDSMMIAEGSQTITNLEKCYFVGENNSGAAFNASGARFAYVRDRAFKFKVDYYGNVYAHAYNTASADYAEYFEWSDGNPDEEDRMGLLVDQIGDKIAPAQGDEFFGAISARASVVGNAYDCEWHGKYLTDVYGQNREDENGHAIISPDYDERLKYIPRSQRPEWGVVGLLGRIIIRDDGSCEPGGYVSARKGVGTSCCAVTNARVLRRIDETHIEILMK